MSHTRSNAPLTERQYPDQDWTGLGVGENVDIRYPNGRIERAKVDAKSPDSRIVWLHTYSGQGRKMYGNWEGVCLTLST